MVEIIIFSFLVPFVVSYGIQIDNLNKRIKNLNEQIKNLNKQIKKQNIKDDIKVIKKD